MNELLKHSLLPWSIDEEEGVIRNANGDIEMHLCEDDSKVELYHHIVRCINAVGHVEDPAAYFAAAYIDRQNSLEKSVMIEQLRAQLNAAPDAPKKRFFQFFYTWVSDSFISKGYGNLFASTEDGEFPSQNRIIDELRRKKGHTSISITSFHEFATEADYETASSK